MLMSCGLSGIWRDMETIYRKMGLSEEEIAERLLCKIDKVLERKKGLGECDK